MMYNPHGPDTVLIVDDETDLLQGLIRSLSRRMENIEFLIAEDGESALVLVEQKVPDLVLLDIQLGRMSGMEVLDKIHFFDPATTVVMMTAFGSIELAVEAIRRGAWDFVAKPLDLDSLARLLSRGLERNRLQRDNQLLLSRLQNDERETNFIGNSQALQRLVHSLEMVAKTDYTVLIRGSSGTGKEIAAKMIHRLSDRCDRSFVMVNCPAIPEHLLESELFGHCRGAFTGAESDHEGLFVQADGGTICLDEIGDIPVSIQTKLLRVLQNKEIKILGSKRPRPVDVRILSSTNQDLEGKIAAQTFREDLFYRLNVVSLHTPALEDIAEDIALIADHFLKQTCAELGCEPKSLSLKAVENLTRRKWPGNARQLQNTIRRAAMFCPDDVIGADFISQFAETHGSKAITPRRIEPYKKAKDAWLNAFTNRYVTDLLQETSGNISQAARLSGLSRAALQRIIKRQGISSSGFKAQGEGA